MFLVTWPGGPAGPGKCSTSPPTYENHGVLDSSRDGRTIVRAGHFPQKGVPMKTFTSRVRRFLVSEDGGFITGQTIHVNGGAASY